MLLVIVLLYIIYTSYIEVTLFKVAEMAKYG